MDGNARPKRDWALVVGGIAVVIIGFVILVWPGLTMVSIAAIAGAMFLVAAAADLVNLIRFRGQGASVGWAIVNIICDVVLGVLFLMHPITGAVVLAWFVGAFILAYGVFAVVASVSMRKQCSGWGWMLCNGLVSILCGAMFFLMPEMFAYFLGFFLMMRGVTMAVYGATNPGALTGGPFGV